MYSNEIGSLSKRAMPNEKTWTSAWKKSERALPRLVDHDTGLKELIKIPLTGPNVPLIGAYLLAVGVLARRQRGDAKVGRLDGERVAGARERHAPAFLGGVPRRAVAKLAVQVRAAAQPGDLHASARPKQRRGRRRWSGAL